MNYAVNKNAVVQIYGASESPPRRTSRSCPQCGSSELPHPNNGDGDLDKARKLPPKPGIRTAIWLLYQTLDPYPRVAQSVQASPNKAGLPARPRTRRTSTANTCSPQHAKRGV
jgi:hypothetical protein